MSAPITTYDNPAGGARNELVSAMSALNMYPDPIPGATGYLSEVDAWAKHAMEHMRAAFAQATKADEWAEWAKARIFRLETQLRAAQQGVKP